MYTLSLENKLQGFTKTLFREGICWLFFGGSNKTNISSGCFLDLFCAIHPWPSDWSAKKLLLQWGALWCGVPSRKLAEQRSSPKYRWEPQEYTTVTTSQKFHCLKNLLPLNKPSQTKTEISFLRIFRCVLRKGLPLRAHKIAVCLHKAV